MTTPEFIFDVLVWLIGSAVVLYMLRRYWVMFRSRQQSKTGCSGHDSTQGSCQSCPGKKNSTH